MPVQCSEKVKKYKWLLSHTDQTTNKMTLHQHTKLIYSCDNNFSPEVPRISMGRVSVEVPSD